MDKKRIGISVVLGFMLLAMLAVYVYAGAPGVPLAVTFDTSFLTPGNNTIIAGTKSIGLTTDPTANVTYAIMNFTGGLANISSNVSYNVTTHNFTWITTNGSYPYGVYNITATATNQTESVYTIISNITVDNAAPNVTSLTPSSSTNASGSINITANISENSPFRDVIFSIVNSSGLRIANLTATRSGTIWSHLWVTASNVTFPDAVYNISMNATDTVNNSNFSESSVFSLTVDNTAPTVVPILPVNNLNLTNATTNTTQTINVTVRDATTHVVSVTFSIYNNTGGLVEKLTTDVATGGNATGGNYTATLNTTNATRYPDGTYNISVNATDTLSNVNSNNTVRRFTIDTTQPSATFTNPTSAGNLSGTQAINVSVSDVSTAVNFVRIRILNSSGTVVDNLITGVGGVYSFSWATANGSYADGTYTISVLSNDTNNNYNVSTRSVTVDNTAPIVTKNYPANTANLSGNLTLNVTSTDAASAVSSLRFGVVNSTGGTVTWLTATQSGNVWTATLNTSNGSYADGTYNVSVNSTDNAGNIYANASVFVGLVVDNTLPQITGQVATISTSTLAFTVTYNTSEIANATLKYGAGLSSNVTSFLNNRSITLSGLEDTQLYYYNITACDNAGNCNTSIDYNATTSHIVNRGAGGGASTDSGSGASSVTYSGLRTVGAKVERVITTVGEKVTLANLPGNLGTHSVTYKSADASTKSVTLTIASTPQTITVAEGESQKVDLNDDNTYDLLVTLSSFVSATNFKLKFEVLDSKEQVVPTPVTPATSTETTAPLADGTKDTTTTTPPATDGKDTATAPKTSGSGEDVSTGGLGGGTWALIVIVVLLVLWFGWKKMGKKR